MPGRVLAQVQVLVLVLVLVLEYNQFHQAKPEPACFGLVDYLSLTFH